MARKRDTAVMRPSKPAETVPPVVRAVAFWAAILLPLLYLPLFATGLDTRVENLALIALLAVNAAMILLGHQHETD